VYKKILVPVDGSDTSVAGLLEAVRVAESSEGRIRLVHVINELIAEGAYGPGVYAHDYLLALRDSGSKLLERSRSLVRRHGIEADTILVESMGSPAGDFILQQAKRWPADLIVMGTHGRHGIARICMGSDAEHVLRGSHIPVMLVRDVARRRNKNKNDGAGAVAAVAPKKAGYRGAGVRDRWQPCE
jgi:nucleotide-binding universal stress UspA family protein